jgi:hypothetical protein
LVCLLPLSFPAGAAELSTLFTTPQERQLINANRYKSVEIQPAREPDEHEDDHRPAPVAERERVTREYVISGITISRDGRHTVWINSVSYEDGAQLDDRSRIKVMDGDQVRVRITAPDGQDYFVTSGETVEVNYLAPVDN